jgi:hypothetical protein
VGYLEPISPIKIAEGETMLSEITVSDFQKVNVHKSWSQLFGKLTLSHNNALSFAEN